MRAVDQFCGQKNGYSRSITLRNRLIPIGKTEENLARMKFLESDQKRADTYPEVKLLTDNYHRLFIQEILSSLKLEWEPLFDEYQLYQRFNPGTKFRLL